MIDAAEMVAEPHARTFLCEGCGATEEWDCICEPAIPEGFRIDSEERAEWLLGKLADVDASHKRISDNAAQMLRRLDRRREGLLRRFGYELHEYCEERRREPGFRGKTLNFLQGKCNWTSRTVGGPKVTDTEAALAYCQEHDELVDACVTVSYRLRAADYIKQMEETGEILPGIEILPERVEEAFYINGARLEKETAE